ncbi:ABC transporter permease [Seleniivibrio woodruffii]|uniref:ABC-2 type transport system permease protein n=1 Tax=Seleniivibrio woodruffii TaxID=1078050 RepID=A0A4R1KEL8_9BACT|nr:ABC transporter permease [Seleniivibrio woodruffii]TCK62540.1 ABC-2 type transport system permease protein [Seleniivibrio woodruffii]TVZ37033.1 ABC-2 type transport system permease protein [Seleniivibrio woodruffii]
MMNPRRLKAVAVKEFIHIIRDWRSLFLAVAIPVMLILLFGYALNTDLKNIPTAVADYSDTPQSRELISLFDGSDYFHVTARADGFDDIQKLMREQKALVGIIIKKDFAKKLLRHEATEVQVLVDGSDANTGRMALNYVQALSVIYNTKITAKAAYMGVQPRAWYNQGMVSTYMIVPGILAIVMSVIAAMLASVTVAREWETGTMEQLISTPVTQLELTFGKFIPLYCIGLADIIIAVGLGRLVFDVPMRGNPALLFFVATLFLTGVLFFGLVLSINLKKQVLANQIALITGFLPTMILSGFVFTISNMPLPIQALTYIFPARYFVSMLKSIYLKGVGLEIIYANFLFLCAYTLIMIVIANKRLKLRLN